MMNKDNRNAIIIGLLLTIAFMSVGYALLSKKVDKEELKTSINNTYSDVSITTISSVETMGSAQDVRSYISGNTEITIYPKIIEKNDLILYNVNIKNNGDRKAVLKNINITPSHEDNIICSVSNISAGEELLPGDSKMFTIEVMFDEEYEKEYVQTEELKRIKVYLDYSK